MNTDHLILTTEISEQSEPNASKALDLFSQRGPSMVHVNRIFSQDK
ncbi:hypothetical protein PN836_005980 [Ningiella sp. W23]